MSKTTIKALSFLILSSVVTPTISYSMMPPDGDTEFESIATFSPEYSYFVTTDKYKTAKLWKVDKDGNWILIRTFQRRTPNAENATISKDDSKITIGTASWEKDESGKYVRVETKE